MIHEEFDFLDYRRNVWSEHIEHPTPWKIEVYQNHAEIVDANWFCVAKIIRKNLEVARRIVRVVNERRTY